MPPQSRGRFDLSDDALGDKSPPARRDHPPGLMPYVENSFTSPTVNDDQATPQGASVHFEDDGIPTPVGPRFLLEERDDEDRDDDEAEDEDEDHIGNDEEFESHYSRQESPASSEEDDGEESAEVDEDEELEIGDAQVRPSRFAREDGEPMQRISSYPSSTPYLQQTSMLHMSYSTTSLPRAAPPIPPPLYPPFYNRPPTPLPPSPSLTSLLRPPSLLNRSTTSTRPTTPDSSDLETPATNDDTEAAVASSALHARPLPPTSPKVPTYEYYGFVLYLASTLAFFLYIMWAYLPSPFLHALGITYYPNRWWALAVPSWIVMALIYTYVALACWNTEYLTLRLNHVETLVDDASNVAILDDQGRVRKGGSKRLEADLEERRRKEILHGSTSFGKKKAGSGSGGRKKDRRRKDHRAREKESVRRASRNGPGALEYTSGIFQSRIASDMAWTQIWNEGTDAVMDVPIGGVCEVLYGDDSDT